MTGSLFFYLSKLAWLLIAPDSLLLILVLLVWLLLWRGAWLAARKVLGFTALLLLAVALLPVGEWLFTPLETRFPANPTLPGKVDGIIVLGGAEDAPRTALWGQVEVGDGCERHLAFLALARRYPGAKLVYTGGSGSMVQQEHREAEVARRLYGMTGFDASRVIFETSSRNTYENGVNSKALVKPRDGEQWILVTTAWHMPRAVGVFRKVGWPVIPFPVDHRTMPGRPFRIDLALAGHLDDLTVAAREWIGLAAYHLTGKSSALLPGSDA
ncbi:MAG: YdcF family protein [Desulfobulbaceae bacterium]|nr:YdcF family protein [Desulfobulbaceae bacterium]